jgi:hypothetical protein
MVLVTTLMPQVLARAHAQALGVRFSLQPQVEDPARALERGEVDLLGMALRCQISGGRSAIAAPPNALRGRTLPIAKDLAQRGTSWEARTR